jgi:hypothetical protein
MSEFARIRSAADAVLERPRKLPFPGRILVPVGQSVGAGDLLAETELPGRVLLFELCSQLETDLASLPRFVTVKKGEAIHAGQILAETPGFLGLFRGIVRSPIDGWVEAISWTGGHLILRGHPTKLTLPAFYQGTVTRIIAHETIVLAARGLFVQGCIGRGGEAVGTLMLVSSPANDPGFGTSTVAPATCAKPASKGATFRDAIIVTPQPITAAFVQEAWKNGACGVIAPSMNASEFRHLSSENPETPDDRLPVSFPVVLIEGFGNVPMNSCAFELLAASAGKTASLSGKTQVRAGAVRPEVFVPVAEGAPSSQAASNAQTVGVGSLVRVVAGPFFGSLGKIMHLPEKPAIIPSASKVRVAEIELLVTSQRILLPRANLEVIDT